MQNSSRSYDFLWLSIALLPLIGLSFMLTVPAQDYWWYLRLGRDILSEGAVPLADTMGYSRAGQPIFYQQWLAGILFHLVYQAGGAALTFLLRAVLLGLAYGLLWWMMREASGPRTATILLILIGLSTSNNWVMRPQLFAYPLFMLCALAVYKWQAGQTRWLFLLPLSTLLWVNLHGSFVLPFLLAGAALVFGDGNRKTMFAALAMMAFITLLNPRGIEVWQYLVFILNNPSDYLFSVEWKPPTNAGWQMNIFFAWILAFAPLAALSRGKLSRLEWVWFLGFGWLAFSGVRYVIWLMLLLGIWTAKLIGDWARTWLDTSPKEINPRLNLILASLLLFLPLIFLPGARDAWWNDAPDLYEPTTTPIEAVEFLKAHPEFPAPMWNDYAFGSYLEFALPSRPTWMDTRMYSFSQAQWEEYVRVTNAEGWQQMFDREGINLLLLSKAAQSRLVDAVSVSDVWCQQYTDEYAVIFSRCEAK